MSIINYNCRYSFFGQCGNSKPCLLFDTWCVCTTYEDVFAQYTVVVIVTFFRVFGSTTELYKFPVCFPSFSPIFFKMDNDIAPATSQKLITYLTQVTENTNVKNECKVDFSLKLCFTIYFNAFFTSWSRGLMYLWSDNSLCNYFNSYFIS